MTAIEVKNGGFTPELWSEKININLDKQGCYTDIVNRKYEGEIKQKGDKVKFYTIGSLTVADYNPTSPSITYTNPTGDIQELLIDQMKIIPFTVDDIHQVQSNINLVDEFTKRIAVAGSETKDAFIHSLALANAGKKLHSDAAVQITKENVWAEICSMLTVLTRKNAITTAGVDYSGKRPALVITPEFEGLLLQTEQFFTNAFGDKVLRNGQIGRIGKFDVFVNTNVEEEDGEQTIVALTSDAITYAEQITKTEVLRDKDAVGDFVRSLMVYGGKVANPDCIVTNKVKYTA